MDAAAAKESEMEHVVVRSDDVESFRATKTGALLYTAASWSTARHYAQEMADKHGCSVTLLAQIDEAYEAVGEFCAPASVGSIRYPRPITYVLRFADGDRIELNRSQARRMLGKALSKGGAGYVFAKQSGARTVHMNAGKNPDHSPIFMDVFVGRPQTQLRPAQTERQWARRDLLGVI